MGLRTKFASVMGAVIMAAGLSAPALAQEGGTQNVPVDIEIGTAAEGASLTMSVTQTVPFPDVAFRLTDQTVNAGITFSVQDTRGRSQGWQLSVSGSDFTSTTTDDVIPIENLDLQPGAVTVIAGSTNPTPVASSVIMGEGRKVLFSAPEGTGNGRYASTYTVHLLIPGGTDIGLYETTITAELTTAP